MDWSSNLNVQLGQEAGVVGMLLLPVYEVMYWSLGGIRWKKERNRDYTAVFLSGAMFHILAEASGLNDWYIKNGLANTKSLQKINVVHSSHHRTADVSSLAYELSRKR